MFSALNWAIAGAATVGVAVFSFGTVTLAQTSASPEDPVVAAVDGDAIRLSEVIAALEALPQQYRQVPMPVVYPQLLDQLVSRKLLAHAARAENLQDDEQVRERMTLLEERLLQEVYLTRRIEAQLTEDRLRAHYQETIGATPGNVEVHARHILLSTEEEAMAAIAELAAGGDFTEVAKAKSTGPSAAQGGDLGYFSKDQMVPEFATAAFAMKPGDISTGPVQTSFGWHVIMVVDRRESPPPSFDESLDQVRQELTQMLIQEVVDGLRGKANIERYNMDGSPLK